jgi:antibiotic biosynthesis monooxygenase (ABM) superfamily enzyme
MIRIVIAVDIVPGHEAEREEQWRMLREVRNHFPGFRGASLLRDSEEPTHYLSLSEWDGHDELARAVRWMTWLRRATTLPWTQAGGSYLLVLTSQSADALLFGEQEKPA